MAVERKPVVAAMLSGLDPARIDARRPSIDSARRRLGGRVLAAAPTSARAQGSLVDGAMRDGTRRAGVVLFEADGHCDAWFEDHVVRRVRSDAVVTRVGPAPEALVAIAAEMRLFAMLVEGDRVRWERGGRVVHGCIVEKCRYGAIVVTCDARLVALGFRKLWPVVVRGVA